MKTLSRIILSFLVGIAVPVICGAEKVKVSTPGTSLILEANKGQHLRILYYGGSISDKDAELLGESGFSALDAYPVYGQGNTTVDALSVTLPDGTMALELVLESFTQKDIHTPSNGYNAPEDAVLTTFVLKDKVYPITVNVFYKAFKDVDMIETWTEISNGTKGTVILRKFDSGYLPIRRGEVWASHMTGTWADEARLVQEELLPGMLRVENKDGVRNAQSSHAEMMFSLDGKPSENSGNVIGAALCYSGNYHLDVITNDSNYHHFIAGIHPDNSEYPLAKDETFTTPSLALTFSCEGLSGASRNFHKWARAHKLAHGDKERKILLNSWEGVNFNINEPTMDKMMGDIAMMGGELFVMDDGWFGVKYPRKNDTSSLGDWKVDENKLPHGIQWLVDAADSHKIKFGIWIEPEMANRVSELYEAHPEWVINAPGRELSMGRGGSQLVLDLGNPQVQDYVFSIVDELMTKYPGIDYIKWDANMSVQSHGSTYLPKDQQSKLYIEYHRGFAKVCDRIRAKYPDLTIQACASGGGRANYGVLPWFDEFWVSDNTDALQRIYLQWGTSYFFPAIAMASHISTVPNHTNMRVTPLKFRVDVAMSGRLGMELQPKDMTEEQIKFCQKAIGEYKEIRPTIQFGDLYRLISPYENKGLASLMYCDPSKDRAVFFWWKTEHFHNQHLPRVKMAGLDPDRNYTIREIDKLSGASLPFEGKSFSGKFLMENGLDIPAYPDSYIERFTLQGYSSRVLVLEAE